MTFGLETAINALNAARLGIQTAGQNVANAATPGYSRQRLLLGAALPFTMDGRFQVGTGVKVNWEALDLPVTAVISVTAPDDRPLKEVADGLRSISHVYSCYAVTGEFDLFVMVRARSSNHLGELLEKIRQHAPGRTRAIVVLATYFEGRLPALES